MAAEAWESSAAWPTSWLRGGAIRRSSELTLTNAVEFLAELALLQYESTVFVPHTVRPPRPHSEDRRRAREHERHGKNPPVSPPTSSAVIQYRGHSRESFAAPPTRSVPMASYLGGRSASHGAGLRPSQTQRHPSRPGITKRAVIRTTSTGINDHSTRSSEKLPLSNPTKVETVNSEATEIRFPEMLAHARCTVAALALTNPTIRPEISATGKIPIDPKTNADAYVITPATSPAITRVRHPSATRGAGDAYSTMVVRGGVIPAK